MPRTVTTPSGAGLYLSSLPTVPTSGVPQDGTQTSGPWMIETQKMDIDYVRVPTFIASAETMGLATITCNYQVKTHR